MVPGRPRHHHHHPQHLVPLQGVDHPESQAERDQSEHGQQHQERGDHEADQSRDVSHTGPGYQLPPSAIQTRVRVKY